MSRTPVKPDRILVPPTRAEAMAKVVQLNGTKSRAAAAVAAAGAADPQANDNGTTGELWLYGLVGGWYYGFNADSVARALRGMEVDNLIVRIHSPGGSAPDGVAIGNLLRNYDATVTVVVDGLAASAASVIAIAGDRIVMCPGSQMMVHDAKTGAWGDAQDLRTLADWIDGQSDNYASVYAAKAGGTPEEWRQIMLANDRWGTWYTADQAVAAGLADEVGTRIAVGSPPTGPDDEDFLEDDDSLAKAVHDLELLEHYVPAAARAAWNGETPKPPTASAGGSTETEGGSAVAFSPEQITELRSTLGLADDADEAAIVAAAAEIVDKVTEPPETDPTATATIPKGHVVIPEARLSDLESTAKTAGEELATLKAAAHATAREAFLDANKSKFAADNRDKWAAEYDRNPEGTAQLFAAAADLIPSAELGHGNDQADAEIGGSDVAASVRESDEYKNWS